MCKRKLGFAAYVTTVMVTRVVGITLLGLSFLDYGGHIHLGQAVGIPGGQLAFAVGLSLMVISIRLYSG
jgi:hypothetical protein